MNDLHASFSNLFKRAACFAPVADLDAELLRLRLDKRDAQEVNHALVLARNAYSLDCPRISGLTELIKARQGGHAAPGDNAMPVAQFLPAIATRRQPQAA